MVKEVQIPPDIEPLIDRLAESYLTPNPLNSLESAALPNRRAVIEGFNHLVPVLSLGFYSTRPLNQSNLRYTLSEHIYPAYEILNVQISRAIAYECHQNRFASCDPCALGKSATITLLEALPEIRQQLSLDVTAAFEGDPSAQSIEEVVFSYPGLRALTAHRIAHHLYRVGVPLIPRIIAEYAHGKTGIDIHAGAQIGDSFFIDHGDGVVIGETAIIGRRVKIYQGVTLGGTSLAKGAKRHPTLGRGAIIGAGAKVLGAFTVGEGAKVGSNAVVVKEVPPGATAVGNPARIIEKEALSARDDAAARMFAAYGLTPNGDDPLSKAMHGLIDNAASQELQLVKIVEALKAAGIQCETVPELDKFNREQMNKLVE